jgi:hypothetical protein
MSGWRGVICGVIAVMVCVCAVESARAQGAEEAAGWLNRAKKAMRWERVDGVLHYRAGEAEQHTYESDRMYPPYLEAMETQEGWFDLQSGAERLSTVTTFPGGGPLPAQMTLTVDGRAWGFAGDKARALPATSVRERNLNPWAVVWDWGAARDARVEGEEIYRDYRREVLVRGSGAQREKLLLDLKTGFPVELETEEKHYLWGQQKVEYVYTNWTLAGGVMVAGSSFRIADGREDNARTVGDVDFVKKDAAGALSVAADVVSAAGPAEELPMFLRPIEPKVIKLGERTYLLSNPGYNELVTEVGEGASAKVFVFDATQSEVRAKEDAAAIAKLFPGAASEPARVAVVVTDIAWPHVSGVRWWVAQGATIVSHHAARKFLEEVVARKWTLAPDELEKKRTKGGASAVKLNFVGIDKKEDFAGGAVRVRAIDGIGSEVSLVAFLPGDKLLWGSDYVQTTEQSTSYADEVAAAVKRAGFEPERVVAEHIQVTDWSKIEELVKKDEERK